MASDFPPISSITLAAGTRCLVPAHVPRSKRLELPALDFMTDFLQVTPVTVGKGAGIEAALERMKSAGVRLLLVVDDSERVIGLVTARDIQGEKPVEIAQSGRLQRSEILVEHIMTPQSDIQAFNLLSVRNAQVGHVVETLRRLERQHMLVVEVDQANGAQSVRGLFSSSQIAKQLGLQATPELAVAHSLAEMVRELG